MSICACANLLNQLSFFLPVSCNSASLPFYKIYLCSLSLILSRMFHSLLCLSLSPSLQCINNLCLSHQLKTSPLTPCVGDSSFVPQIQSPASLPQVRPREADLCRLHHSHAFESWILIIFAQWEEAPARQDSEVLISLSPSTAMELP